MLYQKEFRAGMLKTCKNNHLEKERFTIAVLDFFCRTVTDKHTNAGNIVFFF